MAKASKDTNKGPSLIGQVTEGVSEMLKKFDDVLRGNLDGIKAL